jgi:hypothetical protein
MKAFLMHSARDFDAEQLLIRRENESRHRRGNVDSKLDLRQLLPWNEQALRQDLGLDVLLATMSQGDEFLLEVAKVAVLSSLTDLDAIHYRQRSIADGLKNSRIVREMYQIAVDAIEGERKGFWGFSPRYPAGILHRGVEALQIFVGALKRLRNVADHHAAMFESEGFLQFFTMLKRELSDDYFVSVERHLQQLKFRHGVLVSAQLGSGNKGAEYVLRKPREDQRSWLTRLLSEKAPSFTFHLHPRDEAGTLALAQLSDRGINLVANALGQSTDHVLSFFQMLRTELAFYVGCLNLYERLAGIKMPVCFPGIAPAGERRLSFSGLYDVSLALSKGGTVVGNDVDGDHSDLVMITGANTGGKSTFLRSMGLAYLMMQAGMFVAAATFSSEVCDGLYTHYRREEDAEMESGKWDEELSRMSVLVESIRTNSAVLFNESFASTNEREGSEIASQIVRALLDKGVKVFFVTHLYHLAHSLFVEKMERATFLRAERLPDGTRPFKLVAGGPLQTSYGEDLYTAIFSDSGQSNRESSLLRG